MSGRTRNYFASNEVLKDESSLLGKDVKTDEELKDDKLVDKELPNSKDAVEQRNVT